MGDDKREEATSAPTPPRVPTGQTYSCSAAEGLAAGPPYSLPVYHDVQLPSPPGWSAGSPHARAIARRSLNQQVIDSAYQAGGEVAWANLATACISNAY